MFGLIKRKQKNKKTTTKNTLNNCEPPKGWYVQQASQNPLHMLWDVALVSFDDVADNNENPRYCVATEKDSYQEALTECINNIEKL